MAKAKRAKSSKFKKNRIAGYTYKRKGKTIKVGGYMRKR